MRANMPADKFEAKTNMKLIFGKLTRKYKKQELINIIVSNFANGDKYGGMPFDSNAMDVYKDWVSRRNKRSYQFEQDLNSIYDRMKQDNIEDCTVDSGHPLIIKMLLGKQIALETVVIINNTTDNLTHYFQQITLRLEYLDSGW